VGQTLLSDALDLGVGVALAVDVAVAFSCRVRRSDAPFLGSPLSILRLGRMPNVRV
jgi:hypothetical protein